MSERGASCLLVLLAVLAFWLVAGLLVAALWDDLVAIARAIW